MQINLLIKLKGWMSYTGQLGEEAPHVSTMVHVMSPRRETPTVHPGREKTKPPSVKRLKELWQKVVQRAVPPSQWALTHQVKHQVGERAGGLKGEEERK